MKSVLLLTILASAYTVNSFAAKPGRSLPSGEETPYLVEKVFQSSAGEVEILNVGGGGHSALVRLSSGETVPFHGMNGDASCDDWLSSLGETKVNSACELLFSSKGDTRLIRVSVQELKEGSLFDQTKRGANVAL